MYILAIVDKAGRIQHSRMSLLSKILPIDIEVASLDNFKSKRKEYDVVYFAHFSLFDKKKMRGSKGTFASVTSHKCLSNIKDTIKKLSRFDRVSVNNILLFDALCSKVDSSFYTPNGVDTKFFFPSNLLPSNDKLKVGWVGNKDRAVKNYSSILKPLMKKVNNSFIFDVVASSKRDSKKQLLTAEQMRDYYQSLDYFLVTSSAEGTPNPAMEALSCGVPVITTRVGNMVEIIKDGKNGVFVDGSVDSFEKALGRVKSINHRAWSREARESMLSWDWSIRSEAWSRFLYRSL